jgi:hypothetical protein
MCLVLRSVESNRGSAIHDLDRGDMLSRASRIVQLLREDRLDTESWTAECSPKRTNGDGDNAVRFCDILHLCNPSASRFKSSKIRIALEEFTGRASQAKLGEDGERISSASTRAAAVCPDTICLRCNGRMTGQLRQLFSLCAFAFS